MITENELIKLGYKKKTKLNRENGLDFSHNDENRDYLVYLSRNGEISVINPYKSKREPFENISDFKKFKNWHDAQ